MTSQNTDKTLVENRSLVDPENHSRNGTLSDTLKKVLAFVSLEVIIPAMERFNNNLFTDPVEPSPVNAVAADRFWLGYYFIFDR